MSFVEAKTGDQKILRRMMRMEGRYVAT